MSEDNDFPYQEQFDEAMRSIKAELPLEPGNIYEDCFYHPVLCVEVDYEEDNIWGISLIDGSYPRSCSLRFCGVRKLTISEAWDIRMHGPVDEEVRNNISPEIKWWFHTRGA